MERILFVLVIVLVSSIGGGCYKINGTKIENCVTTACNDIIDSSDMEYQLDCTGCGGDPYPSIQFLYNFTINCENETSEIASGISYILPLCMDNVFIHEDMLIPGAMEYFTFQNITFGDANLQEGMKACNNETILKLLAAIARCNINLSICENCPFKFDGERCNVTYDVNSFEHYSIPSSIPTASTPTSTSSSTTSSSMPTSSIPTSTNYYEIDGTVIVNNSPDSVISAPQKYQLNCPNCTETGETGDYVTLIYRHPFVINCPSGSNNEADSNTFERSLIKIPSCSSSSLAILLKELTADNTATPTDYSDMSKQNYSCDDETVVIKLIAATLVCNGLKNITQECKFVLNHTQTCKVIYQNMSPTTTTPTIRITTTTTTTTTTLAPATTASVPTSVPTSMPTSSIPASSASSTSSSTTSSSIPTTMPSSTPTSTNYYEIDGTVIVNNSPDSVSSAPQKYQLNCPNCAETGETGDYVTLIYRHPFMINCSSERGDGTDSNTFKRSLIKIPSCSSSSLAILLKELTTDNTATPTDYSDMSKQNYSCDDETVVIKLIAATLVCNGLRNITQECKFVLNHTQICKVIYQNMSTTTTTTDSLITQIAFFITPISVILALIILAILIVVTVIVCYRLRSRHDDNSGKEVYACIDESSASFQMTTRGVNVTNIEVNNNSNITTDAMYADIIENNMGGRIRSNSKDSQDSQDIQPSDPVLSADPVVLQANVSYTKFVEGEVADTKLYQELPYIKNQSAYSVASNPLYNFSPAKPFIEPSSSLPELESAFKCGLYQIETGALELGEMFASGQFGVVYRGIYKTEKGDIPVAVKALKDSVSKDTLAAFIREAAIMAQFSHPNVLRLLGVKTTEQPWMIVTELLKTELRELLLKIRNEQSLTNVLRRVLMKFTVEIADGMEYLAMRNFVHRDLAARNVLVAKDLTIRIADFGMTREVGSENSYYTSSGGIVPLRWTAPEAVFFQKYSEKSDVWSYGMTLFEIWTLGDKPWGSATNEKIIETLSTMTCISPPPDCPETVERIMLETWRHEKVDRPTFTGVRAMLSSLTL